MCSHDKECHSLRVSGYVVGILVIILGIIFVLRVRARLAALAEQIRSLRANALEPVSYRPAPTGALGGAVTKLTEEAERLGFTMLGDHLEDSSLDSTGRAMRWFVDGEGTTFGWLAPFDVDQPPHRPSAVLRGPAEPDLAIGQHRIVVVLMSHELASQTITSRQPAASLLSRPPFVDMQTLPLTTSLTETVAKHRKRAQLDDAERGFIPVRTFDQLATELDRMRSKVIAWRKAQPADELLEADLRSLLGSQYGKLAGPLRRRLVAEPA